jgi:pyrimidine operon attenuation protein/uracil phosphoribosyltransferase
MKFKSIKERYVEMMANRISVSVEDLTDNEMSIIEYGYTIFSEKLEDIKILEDENRRISVELANIKSYRDDLFNDKNQ